jgi:glycerol uptake facilitator-like aquaporin
MDQAALWRRLLAELLGSAFLAAVVIGSGIAAQKLSPGAVGLDLLENTATTAAGLYAIILMFGPISGAHFNPVVSFVDAAFGGLSWRQACAYLPAQVAGCSAGAIVANLMFSKAAVSISAHHRATPAHFGSEVVATLGLVLVIFALARSGRGHVAPAAVGAYIGAAYFFTSSTSFANPAIAVGRMLLTPLPASPHRRCLPSSALRSSAALSPGPSSRPCTPASPRRRQPRWSSLITCSMAPRRHSLRNRTELARQRALGAVIGRNLRHRPGDVPTQTGARCTSSPSGVVTPASVPRYAPVSSTPAPRSPWWWPTPTRTSPYVASPTTSQERSPTGATWHTAALPTWKQRV